MSMQLDLYHTPTEIKRMKQLKHRLVPQAEKHYGDKLDITPEKAELELLRDKIK